MPVPVRAAVAVAVLALPLGVAACAPRAAQPAVASQSAARGVAAGAGTIVAIRLLTGPAQPDAGDPRASVLVAIGGGGGGQTGGVQTVEFIVREDAGPAVSVVQANDLGLRPGERVLITGGDPTRLARGAPPPPPGS